MAFDWNQAIVLEDQRTRLTPLHWDHLDKLVPIALANPDLLKYSPSLFGNKNALKSYFESAFKQPKRYPFVIYDKAKHAFAGSTSFGNIEDYHQRVEIGWTWIGKPFQRTGLNRHCKFLLMQYAFEALQYERVELKTDSRNMQSRNAIEGIGGKFEGELRSHTLMPDGYRRSTVYYSILKEEWPEVKERIFIRQQR